ncbi:MAG: hypothetical protein JYX80_12625 [Candidatus Scalindua sediminis]|nr:hypothetical protein [Candidatus Scalindua sediminis]
MSIMLVLLIFTAVFILIFKQVVDRNYAVLYGAVAIVFLGQIFGFYAPLKIVQSVNLETLLLLFGMMLYSTAMVQTNIFESWGIKIGMFSKNEPWLILVSFSLITYALSLFMNNLTAMLIMLPITVSLCTRAGVRPIPIVISELIASNLAGASSMIGDFPNMLIASSTPLHFLDFIINMFPICILGLALLFGLFCLRNEPLIFHKPTVASARSSKGNNERDYFGADHLEDAKTVVVNKRKATIGLIIFSGMITLFIFSEHLFIPPSFVALVGGILALAFVAETRMEVITTINYRDIFFFFFLFIMVGGVDATGALNYLSYYIWIFSNHNQYFQCILTMFSAGFLTIFLNAGPTATLFIPIANDLYHFADNDIIWWALSLGICAGSSAAITGATAGTVAANYLENYKKK